MTTKKTNKNSAPPYAELGAALLKKMREYSRLVGAKTFGATAESRRKACDTENEIAHLIARRGIIRNMAETVGAAIRNTGAKASVYLGASAVEYTPKGCRYRMTLAPDGAEYAEAAARLIVRNLKAECAYKCRRANRDGGFVELEIRKG